MVRHRTIPSLPQRTFRRTAATRTGLALGYCTGCRYAQSYRFHCSAPVLIHRAEEDTVKDVSCIGLESNVLALSEEGILLDGEILVVVREAADACVIVGALAESKRAGSLPPGSVHPD